MSLQGDLELLGLMPDIGAPAAPVIDPSNPGAQYAQALMSDEDAAALAQDPVAAPPTALAPGESVSQSGSVATEAFSDPTFARISNSPTAKGWDKRRYDAESRRLEQGEALNENLQPGFGAAEQAIRDQGAAEQLRAKDAAGDAFAAKQAVAGAAEAIGVAPITTTGAAAMAQAQAHVAAREAEETAKALGKAEIARANYTQQVERLKASRIDPHQLFGDNPLAMGLQNVTSALMVMSGKPSVAAAGKMLNDNLMSAVSASVDAQMQNLQNQQKVADGFQQIYNMVVDENDTAKQARDKVFGAYLAAVEGYVGSQLGQHDSKIIGAETQKALAGLQMKRAETENQIYKDALDRGMEDAKLVTQRELTYANLAVEKSRIAESAAARVAQENAAAQKRIDDMVEKAQKGTIVSPFTSDEGKIVTFAKPGMEKALSDLTAGTASFLKDLEELRELGNQMAKQQNAGDMLGFGVTRTELGHRVNFLQKQAAAVLAKAQNPDGKISDADRELAQQMINIDPGYFMSNPSAAFDQAEKSTRQIWEDQVAQLAIPESLYDELQTGLVGTKGASTENVGVAERERNKGRLDPEPESKATTLVKEAAEYKPGTDVYAPTGKDDAPPYYHSFVKDMEKSGMRRDDGGAFGATPSKDKLTGFVDKAHAIPAGMVAVPNFADNVADLAHMAFFEGDADSWAQLAELSTRTDDVGKLADWAFKNKDSFDRKGIGRLTSEVK